MENSEIAVGAGAPQRGIAPDDYAPRGAHSPWAATLHEMQHAIQGREGFTPGRTTQNTPPDVLTEEIKFLPDAYLTSVDAALARARWQAYRRDAGETEARNVAIRRNWTAAKRRMIPPWRSEDVPRSRQY
jgi:hypothetical protein